MKNMLIPLISLTFLTTALISGSADASSSNVYSQLINQGVPAKPLNVAIKAYHWAQKNGDVKKPILTLVDFTKPSNAKRLWVIDMTTGRILFNGLVTHGKNSGLLYATRFSNQPGSDMSSLGAYTTGTIYDGEHGSSIRVQGLEKGINDNAAKRDIVLHSAWYATPDFQADHGYLGRSWGCFAINPDYSNKVFKTLQGGSFLFAYAPQENHDPNFS